MEREAEDSNGEHRESPYFAARRRFLNPPWDRKQLTYREVRHAGWELANNPHDLRLFGMHPLAWYCLGIRICGRTAVEVTRDRHAEFLGRSVAKTLSGIGQRIADVVDPFVGSGNLLCHMVRATKANRAVGLDNSKDVMDLTRRNFARLRAFGRLRLDDLQLHQDNWTACDAYVENRPTLIIVAPPWGDAFDACGLDVRKTAPPMNDVLKCLANRTTTASIFAMLQIHPLMVQESVEELKRTYNSFPSVNSDDSDIATRVDYLLLRLR
jgi:hypothetical protein